MFKRVKNAEKAPPKKSTKTLTRLQDAAALLLLDKRKNSLNSIERSLLLKDDRYQSLGLSVLHSLLNYYQSLPESIATFYKNAGGLVDHALQRTEAALSIFQRYLKPDENGEYSDIQSLWQYALYTASLLQGIGKLYRDYHVTIYDNHGTVLKNWNPLQESLLSHGSYYDYTFREPDNSDLRSRLNVLLARQLMPLSGFNWIASDASVLRVWLALLNEDLYAAGTLGCVLDTADAIALQQEMDRIAKEIGKGRTQGTHRLGTFNDTTRKHVALLEQQVGIEFVHWLQQGLASGALMINKAPLFAVPGGVLMSVDAFKLFVRENPDFKNWQAVQKGFESLGLHEHSPDGASTGKFEQLKNQQVVSGIALGVHSSVILPAQASIKNLNSGAVHRYSATEIIHHIHAHPHFQASAASLGPVAALHAINANGQWQETPAASHSPSVVQPKSGH